jgi:hypothetical protein
MPTRTTRLDDSRLRHPDVHRQSTGAYKSVWLIHLSKTKIILDYTIRYFHYAGQPLHSHR